MKYTREYLQENKIAVIIGDGFKALQEIDKHSGQNHSYITLEKHYSHYGEDLAIDTQSNCYCSGKYYKDNGWEVISIKEFLEDVYTYEIY